MTRLRSLPFFLLLLSIPAAAQSNRVSIFFSNGDGYGAAYERNLTRAWSVGLAVTNQHHANADTYPFDLFARYAFRDAQASWRPYAGLGVRFVSAPTEPRGEVYDNQWAPEPVVGVDYNITDSWSLRAEARPTLGNTYAYDEPLKLTLGTGWRF